jgi:glycosyltransferase involved in cell wall biosynthesis/2-polyprenyl-3-methyl-5-hydroxy-6-metoxy-1,4-benzoquinol methylase
MDFVIHCLGMPFNGATIESKSLGGSESAAYYLAREIARRGHRVTVFTSSIEEGIWDGVTYCHAGQVSEQAVLGDRFEFYARATPHDVLIIQRHPAAFHGQFASKVNIWQLHDLALHRTAGMANANMWNVDAVTCVSKWHKDQVCEVYGFDPEFVQVVPNGVDQELYSLPFVQTGGTGTTRVSVEDGRIEWPTKVFGSFKMLYQSRPERGLEHLLHPNGIMARLKDTNAHLLVCTYDNNPAHMMQYYGLLHRWADALPNVTMLGSLTKPQLAALQKSCDLLVYPTEFEEVSCISAMEAMHAGLPMLTSVVGALPETCEVVDAGVMFKPLKDGKADEDAFVSQIREFCDEVPTPSQSWLDGAKPRQLAAAKFRTWSAAVDKLEAVVDQCFDRRTGSQSAAVRHCVEHSDIGFYTACIPTDVEHPDEILKRTAEECIELYSFSKSPQAYAAHYAKHCGVYYDAHEAQAIGEDVSPTSRFQGVAQLLAQEVQVSGNELRVMDYGCAHGHYMIPFAKAFPTCRFTGVDVSERAIAAATKWAIRDQVTNVELRIGGQEVFDDLSTLCPLVYDEESMQYEGNAAVAKQAHRDLFDVIIAGEVVEHVPDWQGLLEKFRSVLKPNGYLIITTPYGRWEWSGIESFRVAREHLHHFERQDIVEICGTNETHILYAPANGPDKAGNACGSWVWGVRPREPFGDIDLDRKRKLLAPRETVSACLIVRDGEKTLRKCVDSFIDWVDEVVIAVDPETKDRTFDVIDQMKADYKWKPFTVIPGLPAIEKGFDEARNRSIEPACGDWILWVDADEEVRNPWNLWKYLRPSQHNAYGFPQVHYSADPDQVLTTDYPCRLFRNRKGIKFFGVVHEHPEIEPGKAIPRSAMRFDVKFLHNGYVDEEVRRKRYMRNLPLLHRDLEKYPDRGLNRFLWLRDIAQGLMFEHEQTRGVILEGHRERALQGVQLFEQIIEKDPIRMIVDSLKFYSHCVETIGEGFEADISFKVAKQSAPDLACSVQFKGRFFSKSHYDKLMRKLEQEATRHYESKYL